MYGFRKVADCSDRTYSHPFFRRDKPELLAHVRRVVNDPLGTANANASLNAEGNPVAKPPGGVKGQGPPVVTVPTATAKEEKEEAKRDGGGDESRPVRKKARRVGGVLTSTSPGLSFSSPGLKPKHVTAGGGESTSRGGPGNRNSSPVFPYPSQRQAGGGGGNAATAQHQRHHPSWVQHLRQQQQYHHRSLHDREQNLQAACSAAAEAGKPNPSRQQFSSSMWHQHTGRWGGETLMSGSGAATGAGAGGSSLAEDGGAWTTTSSSASSSVDDVSSPVLLPISPADLDCSSYVPPFRLQPDVSTRLPDTRRSRSSIGGSGKLPVSVSPAPGSMSSAAALFGGGGRCGTADGWNGGVSKPSSVGGGAGPYARPSSSAHYSEATATQHISGLYGGAVKSGNGSNSEGDAAGRGAAAASTSASASAVDESNALSLDKAFGFGNAISRPASFDLSLDRQESFSCRGDSSESSHTYDALVSVAVI